MKTVNVNQRASDKWQNEVPQKSDMGYLGTLIGDPNSNRIVALSTSSVFSDKALTQSFWGVKSTAIDNGFQGHLYTRPSDTLVVCPPNNDIGTPQKVIKAIEVNYEIWKTFAGIELSTPKCPLILASDFNSPPKDCLLDNLTWHVGSMLGAAITRHIKSSEAVYAFVLNTQLIDMLGSLPPNSSDLIDQADTTTLLMDKNTAMEILQNNNIKCAKTCPINEDTDLEVKLGNIPSGHSWVFKPAGGAAGIGVFGNRSGGVSLTSIRSHLKTLKHQNQLPLRFQIQEFIHGNPYGVTASFGKNGRFRIFQIHSQLINNEGKFTGGTWTQAFQAKQMVFVNDLCQQLANIEQPSFSGLICFDIINQKIVEINPRLTASAPISHILKQQSQISDHHRRKYQIKKIDLNTQIAIPYHAFQKGTLIGLVESIWQEFDALVLPQGLNPFGISRLIFINDDILKTAQQMFLKRIKHLS